MLVFSVIFSNFLCAPSNWDPIVDHPKWSYAKVNNLLLASKKHESYNQKKGQNLAVQFYFNIHFLLQRFYTNCQKQSDSICRLKKRNQKRTSICEHLQFLSTAEAKRGANSPFPSAVSGRCAERDPNDPTKYGFAPKWNSNFPLTLFKTYVCFDII